MEQYVTREREQLIGYWSALFADGSKRLNPERASIKRLLTESGSSAHDVRQVHDIFGWASKGKIKCAGAVYRSLGFMKVNPNERDASKPRNLHRENWPRNVHIEHTVLISQLHRMWASADTGDDATAIAYLIANGVSTAVNRAEEIAIGAGRTPNNCFNDGRPFKRYASKAIKDFEVWNLVTRQKVSMDEYTLEMHRHTICALLTEVGAPLGWIDAVGAVNVPIANQEPD